MKIGSKSQVAPPHLEMGAVTESAGREDENTEFSPEKISNNVIDSRSRSDVDVSKLISNRITHRISIQSGRKVEDAMESDTRTKRPVNKTKLK